MQNLSEQEKLNLYNEVIPTALEYRRSFINDNQVIEDTFKTIEQLGFLLLRFPAADGNTSLGGISIQKKPNYSCIYINSRQNLGRQYLSCWHECYHSITGEGSGISYVENAKKDPIEYKADTFAGMILMPENLVRQYIKNNNIQLSYLSHTDIIKMQNYFQVGYSAMLNRIIQIFPKYKKVLSSRFGIASKSRRTELTQKTLDVNGDIKLITPSNDIYIPESFLDHLQYNINDSRISKEKVYGILSVIDGISDGV